MSENTRTNTGFALHYDMLPVLIKGLEAKEVFEFGSGFSSEVILKAIKPFGGKLTTCDRRSKEVVGHPTSLSEEYAAVWNYIEAPSDDPTVREAIEEKTYDLVLHDGAHDFFTVIKDLRKIAPCVKHNGIILVHDTHHPTIRFMSLAVRFGLMFKRHEKVTLSYGYGLTIIRMLGNHENGSIETKWKKGT